MKKLFLFLLITSPFVWIQAQRAIYDEITEMKASGVRSISYAPLKFLSTDIQNRDYNLNGLKKGTVLDFDIKAAEFLIGNDNDFISMLIQVSERSSIKLILKRHEIFAPGFTLFASSDRLHPIDYTPGLYYIGIVEGEPSSLVGISIFKDHVMGIISTTQGNMVIGPIKNDSENRHIFYNDQDRKEIHTFTCETPEEGLAYTEEQLKPFALNRDVADCVNVYFEINDDIVTDQGGAIPAMDYLSGIMNQTILMYANENINMVLSEALAWTTPSPYTGNSASAMLASYKALTGPFNGDLSHLISFDSLYGGIVTNLNGVCNPNVDYAKCFSGIRKNVYAFPEYSEPVFVVTHEMGHLMGSNHTHVCAWNGNGTSIDACGYYPNGSPCPGPDPQIPPEGGTIMSYCTPNNNTFINFSLGFGPQPGNVIRNSVHAAGNCLVPCGPPILYCLSYGNVSFHKFIDKVTIGSINNLSGDNYGYGNFVSLSTNLNAGTSNSIQLKPGYTSSTKYWRVWIDYNGDQDWSDAGEQVAQGSGSNVVNLTFTVPAGSPAMSTRMRVSMSYNTYPPICGQFESGEVENYTVNILNAGTCTDGIQNQGETGIDCGGPCPACATCNDGIQNQGETGIDCGGPCPACPPAPSCTDGIQNQGETGIDCGGPCAVCPPSNNVILLASYFETGWDSWIDGGSDANRVSSSNSFEGQYSIRLADNAGTQSAMTTPTFNLSNAIGLEISFHYYASSMEAGEDFWVQYNNGSTWTTIGALVSGTDFNNNSFYTSTFTVPNFVPVTNGSLRIQCDANDNSDQVFIDQVIVTKLMNSSAAQSGPILKPSPVPTSRMLSNRATGDNSILKLYPNPTSGAFSIELAEPASDNLFFNVMDLTGKSLYTKKANRGSSIQNIEITNLPAGLYFIQILSENKVIGVSRFVKQ